MPDKNHSSAQQDNQSLPFSVRSRLKHIEWTLLGKNELQRLDLIEKFGITPNQIALDFKLYQEMAPGNMAYDKCSKRYKPTSSFMPVFIQPTDLSEFARFSDLSITASEWPVCLRKSSTSSLVSLMQAVANKRAIHIFYQSMSAKEESKMPYWRLIEPHAFASDGDRWHVRAYCRKNSEFRDFVLGRILDTGETGDRTIEPVQDLLWNKMIFLELIPSPSLTEWQRNAIANEYGMTNARLTLNIRESMLHYFKSRYGSPLKDSPITFALSPN